MLHCILAIAIDFYFCALATVLFLFGWFEVIARVVAIRWYMKSACGHVKINNYARQHIQFAECICLACGKRKSQIISFAWSHLITTKNVQNTQHTLRDPFWISHYFDFRRSHYLENLFHFSTLRQAYLINIFTELCVYHIRNVFNFLQLFQFMEKILIVIPFSMMKCKHLTWCRQKMLSNQQFTHQILWNYIIVSYYEQSNFLWSDSWP